MLLEKVITAIDAVPMKDIDTKGDIYEYMLSKLSTAGSLGKFRTPRHIIKMIVDLMKPNPNDIICDQTCTIMIQKLTFLFARNPLNIKEI